MQHLQSFRRFQNPVVSVVKLGKRCRVLGLDRLHQIEIARRTRLGFRRGRPRAGVDLSLTVWTRSDLGFSIHAEVRNRAVVCLTGFVYRFQCGALQ